MAAKGRSSQPPLRAAFLPALVLLVAALSAAQTRPAGAKPSRAAVTPTTATPKAYSPALLQSGNLLFQQDCAFCHGRDATGGETGPNLTTSRLASEDVNGEKIGAVVRNGRPEKGMPRFDVTARQIAALSAFIHTQQIKEATNKGGRKGVEVADLQTGNVEEGKRYFNGAGGCATCHSPAGDLAGVATRYKGLELEELMLFPKDAKWKVTVTLASGQTISGTLEYVDEFTVGLFDSQGIYQSWKTSAVTYKVDPGVNAHADLFSRYTDADVHNLMAYLQTLR